MRKLLTVLFTLCLLACTSDKDDQVSIVGLQEPVEIIRDEWGINHIYAKNQHDLFFVQGYAAAKDRLFQFEIWRRQATGTIAEILGENELKRDIGTRLFKFRGDMKQEMSHYHEDGEEIINAYTRGVNAYIEEIKLTPDQLPIEFKILNIIPEKWTPEVVISRHQGLLGNIGLELNIALAVAKLGEKKVKELNWFHPKDPDIVMDPSIDQALLSDDILDLYNAYRKPVQFSSEDVLPVYRNVINEKTLALSSNENEDAFSI
jgi:penicillin amidase